MTITWIWTIIMVYAIFRSVRNVLDRIMNLKAMQDLDRNGVAQLAAKMILRSEAARMLQAIILFVVGALSLVQYYYFGRNKFVVRVLSDVVQNGLLVFAIVLAYNIRYFGKIGDRIEEEAKREAT